MLCNCIRCYRGGQLVGVCNLTTKELVYGCVLL
nr:MAG TPA: Protein of unknown function (DUF1161) [Caudoviricetes sp.]